MKRYSKGYIYARVDFSGFVKNMETSDYRIRYIVYMQIPDAGHCLTLFGPISGFVPLNRVWFSFTILSVKQGIHKLSFLKGKNELGTYNRVSFLQTGLQNERFLPSTGVKA